MPQEQKITSSRQICDPLGDRLTLVILEIKNLSPDSNANQQKAISCNIWNISLWGKNTSTDRLVQHSDWEKVTTANAEPIKKKTMELA